MSKTSASAESTSTQGPALSRRRLLSLALPACTLAPPTSAREDAGAGAESREGPPTLATDDRIYLALERFRHGFHCSQSVLAAYADEERLREDSALRMAAALAGGSTVGGECGAIAASYLVLGLRYGTVAPVFGDVSKERALFDRVRHLVTEFRKRHGAITCRELLGVDVFSPEGLEEGRRRGLFAERCPRFIADAIALLETRPEGSR